jgi:hypothetical protein
VAQADPVVRFRFGVEQNTRDHLNAALPKPRRQMGQSSPSSRAEYGCHKLWRLQRLECSDATIAFKDEVPACAPTGNLRRRDHAHERKRVDAVFDDVLG